MARNNFDEDSAMIVGAVKAELARRDLSGSALVPVIGLNRNAVYARLRGQQPFDLAELVKIAAFLGMSLGDLMRSAELGRLVDAA